MAPLIWTGHWPGSKAAEAFGFWAVQNPEGPGWLSVPPDTVGAIHDLNRLYTEATWDPEKRVWCYRGKTSEP